MLFVFSSSRFELPFIKELPLMMLSTMSCSIASPASSSSSSSSSSSTSSVANSSSSSSSSSSSPMPPMDRMEKGIILWALLDCLSVAQLGDVRFELEKVVAKMEESSQIMLI